jgi:hypothetical protein
VHIFQDVAQVGHGFFELPSLASLGFITLFPQFGDLAIQVFDFSSNVFCHDIEKTVLVQPFVKYPDTIVLFG